MLTDPPQLVSAMERELASKNPRSLEQVVSRIARDVPGLKNDVNDFVSRVGAFLVEHFAPRVDASPLLSEIKAKVGDRPHALASSIGAQRIKREADRDCNKGNEWACELLGLPKPEKQKKEKKTPSKAKQEQGASDANEEREQGGQTSPQAAAVSQVSKTKQAKFVQEDMLLPGALSEPKKEFKEVLLKIPHAQLLSVFATSEFMLSFGEDVTGQERACGPFELEEWLLAPTMPVEFEAILRELLTFAVEGVDQAGVGGGAEDDDAGGGGEAAEQDFETQHNLRMNLRLKRLAPYINSLTWEEVLRRLLSSARAELPAALFDSVLAALEGAGFVSLSVAAKCDVITFLLRKCLQTKAMRDWVDESQHKVTQLRGEKSKLVKEIRAQYKDLVAAQLPKLPADDVELKRMKLDVDKRTAEQVGFLGLCACLRGGGRHLLTRGCRSVCVPRATPTEL